jgi:hypothetical protein
MNWGFKITVKRALQAMLVAFLALLIGLLIWLHWSEIAGGGQGRSAAFGSLAMWLQALLLAAAAFVAFRQWRTAGNVSRKRVTFGFISSVQIDREILQAIATKRKVFSIAEELNGTDGKDTARWISTLFGDGEAAASKFKDLLDEHLNPDGAAHGVMKRVLTRIADQGILEAAEVETLHLDLDSGPQINSPRNALTTILNIYEIIAIGISRGALDREMMAQWWMTTIVKDYFVLHKAIEISRAKNGNSRLFQNVERLALDWYNRLPLHERPSK